MKFTFTTPSAMFQQHVINIDLSRRSVSLNPNNLNCQHINIYHYHTYAEVLLTIILVFPLET